MKLQRFSKENVGKIPKNVGWKSDFVGKSDDE